MSAPVRRPLPARRRPRPACCQAGAQAAPGACPWHDSWRHVTFTAPNLPAINENDMEDE